MMPDEELRRLAEAATPGPWQTYPVTVLAGAPPWQTSIAREDNEQVTGPMGDENAAYIAAVSPGVVLALLDERDELRERLRRLGAAINNPKNQWWHTGGTSCVPRHALREANRGPREGGVDD